MSSTPTPVAITPYRAITGQDLAPIIADAVVEENSRDESVMTDQPIEVGSTITDHVYAMPQELDLIYDWSLGGSQNTQKSPSFLKDLYQQVLGLKAAAMPVTVYTGIFGAKAPSKPLASRTTELGSGVATGLVV